MQGKEVKDQVSVKVKVIEFSSINIGSETILSRILIKLNLPTY